MKGRLREGVTATDLVLTVTEMLRKKGVVDKFVEFYGDGLSQMTLADRATVANMAPEYGATMGFFPVDAETLRYLRQTGRSEEEVERVERYCEGAGNLPHATKRPTLSSAKRWNSISPLWSRVLPGPSARRTACRFRP